MSSSLAMPLLVVNLGCEMVYILEQRLKAQNIPADKACKVLNDVVKTMFDPGYMEKLLAPQEMYTVSQTRKIFDRLAHSSIMRLSESSMDKLFDLMTMGFKYQLLCSTRLDEIVEITQHHLDCVRGMLEGLPDRSALPLVAGAETVLVAAYKPLRPGALSLLRHTLLRFFQDRRVKVSLFLQEGIQSSLGRIILPSPAAQHCGTVTYYDMAGGLEGQEQVRLRSASIEATEFFVHPSPLGSNLYSKERPKVVPPPRKGDALTAPLKAEEDSRLGADDAFASARSDAASRNELTLLSALLAVKAGGQTDNFKLQLFEDFGLGMGLEGAGSSGQQQQGGHSITYKGNEAYKAQALGAAMRDMQLGGAGGSPGAGGRGGTAAATGGADDGGDLLDLLDAVGG